jgi:hypothetical protein
MEIVAYRMFFDDQAAEQSQLDAVDTITVNQVMDQLWEASIQMIVRASDRGQWTAESDPALQAFERIRVEVKIGDADFVPLIDGPVVGYDASMSADPGQSTVTVRVYDDGVYLTRRDTTDADSANNDEIERMSGDADSDIASDIYDAVEQIADTDVEDVPAGSSDRPSGVVSRGTLMETLHFLAQRHPKVHAWVKAGDDPGQSVGVFKKEDERPSGLPPLVLLGPDRNIDTFDASNNAQSPARVVGTFLDTSDMSVSTSTANYGDVLDGQDDPVVQDDDLATVRLPPGFGIGLDPDEAVQRWAAEYAQAFEARGTVHGHLYSGVLEPYRMIEVKGVNGRISGNYVIRSVTHSLTRSIYTQTFELIRRGESGGSDSGSPSEPTETIA